MITLKDFMETVGYRITEGSDYYGLGDKNYTLTYWNGDQDGHSVGVVFSTETQEVLLAEACDYANNRAYRLLSDVAKQEVNDTEAWDFVKWTDLETDDDWLEKARGIVAGVDYDTRIKVPVDFTDDELLKFLMLAHERDITFNQLVEEALQNAIDECKRDPDGFKLRAQARVEQ